MSEPEDNMWLTRPDAVKEIDDTWRIRVKLKSSVTWTLSWKREWTGNMAYEVDRLKRSGHEIYRHPPAGPYTAFKAEEIESIEVMLPVERI